MPSLRSTLAAIPLLVPLGLGAARAEPPAAGPRATAPPAQAAPTRPAAGGATISLSVKDADLVEVVRSLARIAGLNLVVDPGVHGTVTAELHDVRWDQALAVILKINGLAMEIDGRVVAVAPPARLLLVPGASPSRLRSAARPPRSVQ
jgi:type II secretory pathway component GspD/PulD (secretin)